MKSILILLISMLITISYCQTRASLGINEAMNTTYRITMEPVYYVPAYIEEKRVCLMNNVESGISKRGFFGKLKWCFSIPWISDCDDNSADIDSIKSTMTDMYNELTTEIDDVKAKTQAAFQDVSNKISVIQSELSNTVSDVNLLKNTIIGITNTQRAQQMLNKYNQLLLQAKIQYISNIQSNMLSHIPQQFMLDDDRYNLYLAYSGLNNTNHLVKGLRNTTIAYKKFLSNSYTLTPKAGLYPMCSDYDRIGSTSKPRYFYSEIMSTNYFTTDCSAGFNSIILSYGDYCGLNETLSPIGIIFRPTTQSSNPASIQSLCPNQFSDTICYIRHISYGGLTHNIFTRNLTFVPPNGFKVTDVSVPCPVRMYVTEDLYHISVIPEYIGMTSLISIIIGTNVQLPTSGVYVEEGFMTDYGNIVKCIRYKEVHNWIPVMKLKVETNNSIIPKELIQMSKRLLLFHYDDTYNILIDETAQLNGLDQPGDNCLHKELDGTIHLGENWLICTSSLFARYRSYSEWSGGATLATGISSLMDRYNVKYDRQLDQFIISLKPYITYEWYDMLYYQSTCPVLIDMDQIGNVCSYNFDEPICDNSTCSTTIYSNSSEIALFTNNNIYCLLVYCTTDGRIGYVNNIEYNFTIYFPGITDISQYDDNLQQYLGNLTQQFIDIQVSQNSSIIPNYTDYSQERQKILDEIANMKSVDNNAVLIAWIALAFSILSLIFLVIAVIMLCCMSKQNGMALLSHQLGYG